MNRPYVFCHMMTSLDGKIMGKYMETPESNSAGAVFNRIAFSKNSYYHHQGWISGRVTTDDNFTLYRKPKLDEGAAQVPAGDFLHAVNTGMYYVSIDPSGKLGWESNKLHYGDVTADILEVLTNKASNAYKAFLRRLGISYIVAGVDSLDYALALEKIKNLFGVKTLMLGGGAILNWSFIQAGVCDEVSVVIAASADGSIKTPALFEMREGLDTDIPVSFSLQSAKVMDGDSVWLRYLVKNK